LDKAQLELIKGYVAKAYLKLEVAGELFARQHYDDAVSRAYYAAYHAAQAALLTEGQQAETHRGAVTLFGLLLVKSGKLPRECGRILANLKDDRESGDYEALSFIDQVTAERSIAEAHRFCDAIPSYLVQSGYLPSTEK